MAHYRKLQIGQQTYHYNIGKMYVEIRSTLGKQLIPKGYIGFVNGNDVVVTPKMIRDYVTDKVGSMERYFESCDCKDVDKHLTVNPFVVEIHNKVHYVVLCDRCYHAIADDI